MARVALAPDLLIGADRGSEPDCRAVRLQVDDGSMVGSTDFSLLSSRRFGGRRRFGSDFGLLRGRYRAGTALTRSGLLRRCAGRLARTRLATVAVAVVAVAAIIG